MNKVPIAFCLDDNLELPAGVCLTSLLINAKADTFYDIFILHSDACTFPNGRLNELPLRYGNCKITYRCIGREFDNAFEIRGITVAAYYRLLIPEVIPEYDKIIYSDVDVIFRKDLALFYETTDLTDFYVGGVVDGSVLESEYAKYIENLHLLPEDYIYSGNLIINSKLLREDGIVQKFIAEAHHSTYKYQDMDILNLVCRGKIKKLSPEFCLSIAIRKYAICQTEQSLYAKNDLEKALIDGVIHYNGAKPWVKYCPDFDLWWVYYRKSIFFDPKYHFDFFNSKMNEYDSLPLWKRIKILARWFVFRKTASSSI